MIPTEFKIRDRLKTTKLPTYQAVNKIVWLTVKEDVSTVISEQIFDMMDIHIWKINGKIFPKN